MFQEKAIGNHLFITHTNKQKHLAIIFPGGNNSTDVPTLHYATKTALLNGCDVLQLKYEHKIKIKYLEENTIIQNLFNHCIQPIKEVLNNQYEQIYFICKSLGHKIAYMTEQELNLKDIHYISYTPIYLLIEDLLTKKGLVFTGTNDQLMTSDALIQLKTNPKLNIHVIPDVGHSLEYADNSLKSINVLYEVTEILEEYILRTQ